MIRRDFLALCGAVGLTPLAAWRRGPAARPRPRPYDVLVIGAGVFGTWTAWYLHGAGLRVGVIDAVGPAHSGASSGGESRVTRCGYGDAALYTEWACRSMADWRALSARASLPLFHETGVVWLGTDDSEYLAASGRSLAALGVPFERLSARELRSRYPVMRVNDGEIGFYEPGGGGLMARRAVQQLAAELAADGVEFLHGRVSPIHASDAVSRTLPSVRTDGGTEIRADAYVVACGPWLDRVCPEAMAGRLFVTRQDVVYFAVDRARTGALPVWADLPWYGLPSLEGRGFKVADDTHGPEVDPSEVERLVSAETVARARELLARRFPSIADSPVSETRVCQYESSSNGDFVLDRHPGLDNVWLAGCGSGHGFKHGPAIGAHLAGLVRGVETPIARFSRASKEVRQHREIQ